MQRITSIKSLREAIALLEDRRRDQENELSAKFLAVYDSLKPANIIKNTVRDLVESSEVQHDVINSVAAAVSGYLAKKLFVGRGGTVRKILGNALQFAISNLIRKKADMIKTGGVHILLRLLTDRHSNGKGQPSK